MAIVLDLDDTLYLERDYVRSGLMAAGDWVERTRGIRGLSEAAAALFAEGQRTLLFDTAYAMIGVDASPALIGRTAYEYRRHRPRIDLAPDARDFLGRTSPAPLALITDGWALAQRMKVAALGLRASSIFPIIYTDDWGRDYWKPHPRAFALAERMLEGCDSFVYVADNPAKDFLAPRMLGWRTIQVARPERLHSGAPPAPGHAADFTIGSLDELDSRLIAELVQEDRRSRVG